MKTYGFAETGWVTLPTTIKKVVAHFKSGHTEEMPLLDFLTLKPSIKKQIVKIDCYDEETE